MRPLPVLATCLGLAVCGCGGSDDKPAAEKAPNTVDMKDIAFSPGKVTVKTGDTVTWVNQDDVEHNVVATKGATFKSKLLGKDGTFKFKADKAGTVSYVCTIHPGMEGTIVVQ